MKTDYNGWTNYATWRINLEIIQDTEFKEKVSADTVKDIIEEAIFVNFDTCDTPRLIEDYARAFVSQVNFYEIAKSINEEIDLQTNYEH
jgi:hypothetical protein